LNDDGVVTSEKKDGFDYDDDQVDDDLADAHTNVDDARKQRPVRGLLILNDDFVLTLLRDGQLRVSALGALCACDAGELRCELATSESGAALALVRDDVHAHWRMVCELRQASSTLLSASLPCPVDAVCLRRASRAADVCAWYACGARTAQIVSRCLRDRLSRGHVRSQRRPVRYALYADASAAQPVCNAALIEESRVHACVATATSTTRWLACDLAVNGRPLCAVHCAFALPRRLVVLHWLSDNDVSVHLCVAVVDVRDGNLVVPAVALSLPSEINVRLAVCICTELLSQILAQSLIPRVVHADGNTCDDSGWTFNVDLCDIGESKTASCRALVRVSSSFSTLSLVEMISDKK
jgi:hypothetical protein